MQRYLVKEKKRSDEKETATGERAMGSDRNHQMVARERERGQCNPISVENVFY